MSATRDILIIGGGAIGLCSAYYLSRAGATVTVLDRGEMGHGSSLHNAGYISPSHFVPLAAPGLFGQAMKWMLNGRSPFYIKPRLDKDLLAWGWRFWKSCDERVARRAMPVLRDLLSDSSRLYEDLCRTEKINVGLTKQGLCILFASDAGRRSCEHEAELAHRIGVDATLLDREGLRAIDPAVDFRACGGIYFPGDSHLVPSLLVQEIAALLERSGVRLLRNCAVRGFATSGATVTSVLTEGGELSATEFVLAGGAWTPAISGELGVRLLLQAGKGYSITVRNPPLNVSHPYIFSERRVAVTPFVDSLRFAGTMELAGLDLSITMRRVEAILDAIPLYFGNIAKPRAVDHEPWVGLRPVTPDGMPYLGRLKQFKNLLVATGHAMVGISLAPVTGKLVTEIIQNNPTSHDLSLLDPNRFD